jgi:Cdc6-like AAA superfamily ATPase
MPAPPALFDPTKHWKPIVRAFDPRQPLGPENVDKLYAPRPKSAAEQIVEELEYRETSEGALFLLCGSRGSGKTSELARIQRLVAEKRILLELDLQNALPNPLSTVSLVIALGFAGLLLVKAWVTDTRRTTRYTDAEKKFQEALNGLSEETPQGGKLDVGKILEGLGTTLAAAGVALALTPVAIMGGTAAALAKGLQLHWNTATTRSAVTASEGVRIRVASAVKFVFDTLHELSGRPVLILADGLDKLSDQSQLVQVLNEPKLFDELGIPLVLTGPVNLLHSTEFNALRNIAIQAPLYNLVVHDPNATPGVSPPGIGTLEDLLHRRCLQYGLPQGWYEESAIREMATASGGSIRDFIELVRNAAKLAAKRKEAIITDAHADEAIKDLRIRLQLPLNEHAVKQLKGVLRTMRVTADPECEKLLFNNYILCYPNGDLWYRPHELLVKWLTAQKLDDGDGEPLD